MTPKPKPRDDFKVEPLTKAHDRAVFLCGNDLLDNYLKKQASQDVRKYAAVCFVLTPDGKTIAGYYTLSQYAVDLVHLPPEIVKKLPKYPEVPATLLGRLAVDEKFRGQKLGEFLLLDALNRSLEQSRTVASAAVVVDAKDDSARRFYEHFEFMALPDIPNRLLLSMKTIEELFREV